MTDGMLSLNFVGCAITRWTIDDGYIDKDGVTSPEMLNVPVDEENTSSYMVSPK